jgi:hypothetical protein
MTRIQKSLRSQANIDSIATAKLTAAVMNLGRFFGANTKSDFTLDSLLPFPNESGNSIKDGINVSRETAELFFKLISENRLPIWMAADLIKYTNQWKAILGKK